MSNNKKSGLGKGFDALIPQNFDKRLLLDDSERIEQLDVGLLIQNPEQPRQYFDKQALDQLADSIKQYGVIQPLVVTRLKNNTYSIVAGERRWRASQIAGLKKVPAVVRTSKELERLELAIVENVQRVDLSPIEEAISIEKLHQQFSMTYEIIAKRLGKAPSTINNTVRLLQLPQAAREALGGKRISEGHARAILALKDDGSKQEELLSLIIKHDWSVRQAERYVISIKEGFAEKNETKRRMQTETPETRQLSKRLGGNSVHIRRTAKGGRLEIGFASDEELSSVLKLLS